MDLDLLERLFGDAQHLHELSVESAAASEKEFVKNRSPVIKISYEDGTEYEIRDLETLREIVPGRGKPIKSIDIVTRVGDFTCSIELNTWRRFEPVNIRAAGLEDKVGHFVETVAAELTRETDITVFARRIWAVAWGTLFSILLWLALGWHAVHDSKAAYGLVVIIMLTAFVFTIPIEIFRNRWLPPVAFLWGKDGTRARQAKAVVSAAFATIPLGILINAISALFMK